MSDDEVAAVNVLFANNGLLPIDGFTEYSFGERISINGSVYHSSVYKRAGIRAAKLCSSFLN